MEGKVLDYKAVSRVHAKSLGNRQSGYARTYFTGEETETQGCYRRGRIAVYNVLTQVYEGGVTLDKIRLTLALSFQTCSARGWAGCSLRAPTETWESSLIAPFPIPIQFLPILPCNISGVYHFPPSSPALEDCKAS